MIERVIRVASTLAVLLVLASFGLFAIDEVRNASHRSQDKIAGVDRVDPTPAQERRRERKHNAVREVIDDANDALLAPFASIVSTREPWVHRGLPAGLALLVYGLGLGYLASFARGRFSGF